MQTTKTLKCHALECEVAHQNKPRYTFYRMDNIKFVVLIWSNQARTPKLFTFYSTTSAIKIKKSMYDNSDAIRLCVFMNNHLYLSWYRSRTNELNMSFESTNASSPEPAYKACALPLFAITLTFLCKNTRHFMKLTCDPIDTEHIYAHIRSIKNMETSTS